MRDYPYAIARRRYECRSGDSSDTTNSVFAKKVIYMKKCSSSRSRVPRRVLDQLSRMPVQPHHTLQNQIRSVNNREPHHRPPRSEFRSHNLSKVQSSNQSTDCSEQEPLGHGVLEEDQVREPLAVAGPVCDDEAQEQTGVLRDEVETHFADDEQGEDSQALFAGALAFGWVVPDQREVADGSLGPAWWYVSIVSLDLVLW